MRNAGQVNHSAKKRIGSQIVDKLKAFDADQQHDNQDKKISPMP
jgi:hypothetical protein